MKKLSNAVSDIANNKAQRIKQWEQGKLFLLRTGYQYTLYHRLLVNHKLQQGLIADYHARKQQLDRDVKLIGVAEQYVDFIKTFVKSWKRYIFLFTVFTFLAIQA